MSRFIRLVSALWLAALCAGAAAQGFPAKPVHLVVPFPAGGSADLLARVLGEQLTGYWKQPVLVENKPGAGSIVATQYVQRAPADGYTLLLMAPSFVVNPMLKKEAGYDAMKDFTPVTIIVTSPLVVVVNPSLPARTLKELGELSRTSSGKFSFAAVGPGTTQQMIGEMLRLEGKFDWVYAPYPGGAPAVTALLGNHVTAVVANYSEVSSQVLSGKLRAVAVGSRERLDVLKDVPTLAELGYQMVDGTIWFGFVAPAGVPSDVVHKLQADIARALKERAVREKFVAQGLYPAESTPEQFAAFLDAQVRKYSGLIKQADIKAD
ncbi:MAG TPA: tripartite tricarboxylate transporter substrate binding protein [Usitatibacter sp.]|nr:tripartite tricarboxylate transporter substrate binding protein [Usitatibacter sp.]